MNKIILVIGGLLVLSIGGFVAYSSHMEMKEIKTIGEQKNELVMKQKEAVMASGTDTMMMKKDESAMKVETTSKTPGVYLPYSADKLALAKSSKVVLFFAASWCPTCRTLDSEITLKGVQEGFTILKVDYDNSKELKAKYGVTTQHTLVQVDESGALINKWSGGDLTNIYTKAK